MRDEIYDIINRPERIDRSVFFDKKFSSLVLNRNGMAIIHNLAVLGMTENDIINNVLCCSRETIYNKNNRDRFLSAYRKGHESMQCTYRYLLLKRAQRGSDRAIIFGCKSICGMSDKLTPEADSSSVLSDFVRAIENLKNEERDGTEHGDPTE